MTPQQVRQLALALEGVVEEPHHGFPSFRLGGRILATLPDPEHLHVMLDEEDVRAAVAEHAACEEKWWGKRLAAVRVHLPSADRELVQDLLYEARERLA